MAESNKTLIYSDNETLSNRIESIIKHIQNNPGDSLVSRKTSNEAERHSDISLDESFKRETHKTIKNAELMKATDEFILTSRTHLSRNIIEHWVNTGYLLQVHMNADKYSGTNSLNQELSSCIYCDVPDVKSICRSNSKEQCNNSSNGSSVDTAAYILSNMNIKKKTETMTNITDTKCSKKISIQNTFHRDICGERHELSIGHEMLSNIVVDSNVAISTSALENSNTNNKHANNQGLENNNAVEEELQLAESNTGFTNEICVNGKQDDDISFNNSRESTQNLTEESINIDKSQSFPSQSSLNNSKCIRQKKLYTSRDSPTDIVIAEFKENNTDEMKKELHPAFRDSPPIIKTHKRKRTKFCLNNSQNKSNDISEDNDVSKEMQVAKRQRIFPVIENDVRTSRTSEKERLSKSCNALKEQIKRFSITDYIKVGRRKQPNTRLNRKRISEKRKQSENNINLNSHNASEEALNPSIIVGSLLGETSNYHTRERDETSSNVNLNSHNASEEALNPSITVGSLLGETSNYHTRERDETCSNLPSPGRPKSNCSTAIIHQSVRLSRSDMIDKTQSNVNPNDIKLIRLKPVVVIERLQKQVNAVTSNETNQSEKIVKRKNRSKGKRGRKKKSAVRGERRNKVNNNPNTPLGEILQPVVMKAFTNRPKKFRAQSQMVGSLNDGSLYPTPTTKIQGHKSTNPCRKSAKGTIDQLESLGHSMITRYITRLSEIHNSFNKMLNDIKTTNAENPPNEVPLKRNRRNINKKNNISTNNIRTNCMRETKHKINEHRRIFEVNLPCFRTREDFSDSEDDWDSKVLLTQFISEIQAKRSQKQFTKKCNTAPPTKLIQERMLTDNIDENISTPSTSNVIKNQSVRTSIYSISNKLTSNTSEVIKISSNDKQYGVSKNTTLPKYNNSKLNIKINENDDKTYDDNKDKIKKCIFHTKDLDSDSDSSLDKYYSIKYRPKITNKKECKLRNKRYNKH